MTTRAAEWSAFDRIGEFLADGVCAAVFVLVTFNTQFERLFCQVARIRVAVRIVTLRTSVLRVRILTYKLFAMRRIVALHTEILLTGQKQRILI